MFLDDIISAACIIVFLSNMDNKLSRRIQGNGIILMRMTIPDNRSTMCNRTLDRRVMLYITLSIYSPPPPWQNFPAILYSYNVRGWNFVPPCQKIACQTTSSIAGVGNTTAYVLKFIGQIRLDQNRGTNSV